MDGWMVYPSNYIKVGLLYYILIMKIYDVMTIKIITLSIKYNLNLRVVFERIFIILAI